MKLFFKAVSVVFHPSLIPLVGVLVASQILPYYIPVNLYYFTIIYVFIGTFLFPLFVTYVLLKLKLISSITMPMAQDRKYPFLVSALFYYLTARALKGFNLPVEIYFLLLGGALIILVSFTLLRYYKVSAHVSGLAGILAWLLYVSISLKLNLLTLIIATILIIGLVATSRLYLKAHTFTEVLLGFLIGFTAMLSILWLL